MLGIIAAVIAAHAAFVIFGPAMTRYVLDLSSHAAADAVRTARESGASDEKLARMVQAAQERERNHPLFEREVSGLVPLLLTLAMLFWITGGVLLAAWAGHPWLLHRSLGPVFIVSGLALDWTLFFIAVWAFNRASDGRKDRPA
jgi:hypothetical protein